MVVVLLVLVDFLVSMLDLMLVVVDEICRLSSASFADSW